MRETVEEFKNAISSLMYVTDRQEEIDRIKQYYIKNEKLLDEGDKEKILLYIADHGSSADCDYFLAFCEVAGISFSVEQAKKFSSTISGHWINFNTSDWIQKDWSGFIFKMVGYINGDVNEYFAYMVETAIVHDWICALQNLLKLDKDQHFITDPKHYENLSSEQNDMRISEMVKRYFETGETGEDWSVYLEDGVYEADSYENRAKRKEQEERSYHIPGIKTKRWCVFEKIDDTHYKYTCDPAYVNIIRNEDGTWYYTRLENISRSTDFETLQECIDVAYQDMVAAKL